MSERICPDSVWCESSCDVGCRRVSTGPPSADVYPKDEWPASVLDLPPAMPSFVPQARPVAEPALFGKLRALKARAEAKDGHGMVSLLLRPEEALALTHVVLPEPNLPARLSDLDRLRIGK